MNLDLRPLSVGELFDRAFSMFRRNLWLFVGVAAVPAVFAAAMNIAVQVMQHMTMSSGVAAIEQSQTPEAGLPGAAAILGVVALVFVLAVVYWVMYMVALGATTYAVSELYVGRPTNIKHAFAGMRGRIGALIILMLLLGLRVGALFVGAGVLVALATAATGVINPIAGGITVVVGVLAGGAVFVLMMLRYSIAVPALIVEGVSPGESISRSVDLTKGRRGRVFLLLLCSTMVTYAVMMIFQVPFLIGAVLAGPTTATALWLNIAGAVFGAAGSTFTTPFLVIGLAVLYYDARIREEGFDLQLTLDALDARTGVAQV